MRGGPGGSNGTRCYVQPIEEKEALGAVLGGGSAGCGCRQRAARLIS